jgi:hypothetical protein
MHFERYNMSEISHKTDALSLLTEARKKAQQDAIDAVKQDFEKQQVLLDQVSVLLIETGAIKLSITKIREVFESAVANSVKKVYTGAKRGPKPKEADEYSMNNGGAND